jgi:hypothetical protein
VRGRVRAGVHIGVALAYLLSALVLLLPSLGDLQKSLGPGRGDPLLNVYFLEWGAHQMTKGLPDPWSPPFFYPTRRVLTFSDHLLGPAAAFLVLRRLGLTSAGAYNVLLLMTFVIGGWLAWWVLRRSGLSAAGAFVGGWVFVFTGYRWSAIGHYQVLRMQWIPGVLWTFDRLLERPTPGRAVAFLVFYVLHISGGAYLAVLIHLSLAVLLANRLLEDRASILDASRLRVWLSAALGALAALAVFYLPYLNSSIPLEARRSMDDLRLDGAVLASFVTPSQFGFDRRLLPFLPAESARGALFPGIAALLLMGVALAYERRRFARLSPRALVLPLAGLAVGLIGLLLGDRVSLAQQAPGAIGYGLAGYGVPLLCASAGLVLVGWGLRRPQHAALLPTDLWRRGLLASGAVMTLLCLPTFFAVAWQFLPGMRAMRVPTRAFALALFPMAFLVGVGWDRVTGLARLPWRAFSVVILVGVLVESMPRLPAWEPIPDAHGFPDYARWIAAHDEVKAYIELPLGKRPHWEAVPMYLQTLHWRPLVNGYSAVLPPSFVEVARLCRPFPDPEGLAWLSERGVTHIVLHRRPLPWQAGPDARARVLRFLPSFDKTLRDWGARRVFSEPDTEIYDIRARGMGAQTSKRPWSRREKTPQGQACGLTARTFLAEAPLPVAGRAGSG